MKKKLLTVGVAASLGCIAVIARVGMTSPAATAAVTCGGDRASAVVSTESLALRMGTTIAAVDGGAIAVVAGGLAARISPADHLSGVIRHVSSRPGVGTAYVRDEAGGDVVVADTPSGVHRFPTVGEALQPSLSADGTLVWAQGAGLRVVPVGGSSARHVAGPLRGGVTFSPSIEADGSIVAGVVAPPTRAVPEDEFASNLWRYERRADRWTRLTTFTGGADRWSIVRTPFTAPDGSIEFVRVHGVASQDRAPSFQLWRLRGSDATLIRSLPNEMYLAGFDGAFRLWNVRDGSTGAWRIEREMEDGSLQHVACGAVAVDPLDRPDPDARPGRRWAPLSPTRPASTAQNAPTGAPAIDAVLVGDFSSPEAAADAAAAIREAFGSSADVVDASQAPTLVRPGVWAVIAPITSGDPEAELGRFRTALPEMAGWSWIVSI